MAWPSFDHKKGHAESIIPLFESKKEYAKRQEKISGTCFREVFLRYLFWGSIFLFHKTKALRICGKIRSAKREKSIWEGLFFLVIMYGRA